MTAEKKFVRKSSFFTQGFSFGPTAFLLSAVLLLLSGSWLAFNQPLRENPFQPVTPGDRFFHPIEINPFQRLAKIASNLNDVYAMPDNEQVWAVGDHGLIIHSEDGGSTWQRQAYPERGAPVPAAAIESPDSLLDLLFSKANAGESSYGSEPSAGARDSNVGNKPLLAAESRPSIEEKPIDLKGVVDTSNRAVEPIAPVVEKQIRPVRSERNQVVQQPIKPVEKVPEKKIETIMPVEKKVIERVKPKPKLNAVFFIDDDNGWIVGENGTILRTEDGGEDWRVQESGIDSGFSAVVFVDERRGWAVGSGGIIIHTEDGGAEWRRQASGTRYDLASLAFIDKQHGWAVGAGGTILHTENGGRRWRARESGTQLDLESVVFTDLMQGWAVGGVETFIHTEDGGKTWSGQGGELGLPQTVSFVDEKHGWAVGRKIFQTKDGGKTWETQTGWLPSILRSVKFVDTQHGWAVGDGGVLLRSRDGGKSWQALSNGTESSFKSVKFLDGEHAWVATGNGAILKSEDSGRSWRVESGGAQLDLPSVMFIDPLRGWAAGQEMEFSSLKGEWSMRWVGKIYRTDDGGKSWRDQKGWIHDQAWPNQVFFVDDRHGWAVGMLGMIVHTDDGGSSWETQRTGTNEALLSVTFADTRRGWATGNNGTILYTDDGGLNWKEQATGTRAALQALVFADSQHGWIVGDSGTVLRTEDGGNKWEPVAVGKQVDLLAVSFVDAERGWVAGRKGSLFFTADGGDTWQAQDSGTENDLRSIDFFNARQGWASGVSGEIVYTDDGGDNWHRPSYKRYPAGWYYLLCLIVVVLILWALRTRREQTVKQETIADLLASDRPLHTGDPDPLGFSEIARGLSRFVRNPRTEPPLTIAVTGEWGTGKSSLMNLLYEDLQEQGFSTVWFNAWHHQKSEQLLATLFANIRRQAIPGWFKFSGIRPVGLLFRLRLLLRRSRRHWLVFLSMVFLLSATVAYIAAESGHYQHLISWLNAYLTELSNQLKLVFALGATGATLLPLFVFLKSLQGFALNPLKLMTVHGGEGQKAVAIDPGARYQFAREFQDVTSSLDLGRMIIFIDDLDRCAKENVLEVLEAINFLVSSGSCYIILGMAREWVQICVGLGFKELATESFSNNHDCSDIDPVEHRRRFARQYLEKMINIEVPVPVLDENKAQKLTVPEAETLALSTFDELRLQTVRYLRRNWPMLTLLVMISIGVYWGLAHDLPLTTHAPEEKVQSEELAVWPASDLAMTTEQGIRLTLKAPSAETGAIASTPRSDLEWVLQGDAESLQQGLSVQKFAGGELLLRKRQPRVDAARPESPPVESDVFGLERKTEKSATGFHSGAANQADWPESIPYALGLAVILAGLILLFRKPERVVEDSKPFREALKIWQEWLLIRKQTPRTIKRFLNHLRYMAMRYRGGDEPPSLWQRWKRQMPKQQGEGPVFSEPVLVALHVLYFIEPSWVTEDEKFQRVRQRQFDQLIGDLADEENSDAASRNHLIGKLAETVKAHQTFFRNETLASDEQRRLFLNAVISGDLH